MESSSLRIWDNIMLISIAERFRPFSKHPGVACLLPLSRLRLQIYPAYIKVFDLSHAEPLLKNEFSLPIQGPVKDFTVMQDLEKGCLKVWGESKDGFFRYRVHAANTSEGITFIPEKTPMPHLFDALPTAAQQIESFPSLPGLERLSFGVAKKADWTLVQRRLDLEEILPYWFRLGQLTPEVDNHSEGMASMLRTIEEAIAAKDAINLSASFKNLYLGGFDGLLSCHLKDINHQGFMLPDVPNGSRCSPLLLLTKGAQLIKRMLVMTSNSERIDILPCLIPELHAGRFCNASLGEIGWLDLEWSKKQTRRMAFFSAKKQTLNFHFQSRLKSFRLRKAEAKGFSLQNCGDAIEFESDSTYYLDCFKH
jgi:hypothetical protein